MRVKKHIDIKAIKYYLFQTGYEICYLPLTGSQYR